VKVKRITLAAGVAALALVAAPSAAFGSGGGGGSGGFGGGGGSGGGSGEKVEQFTHDNAWFSLATAFQFESRPQDKDVPLTHWTKARN